MWLRTSCNLTFDISVPTPFILMLRPRSNAQQWIASEEYKLNPNVPVFEYTDGYYNLCQRLVAPPGFFSIRTSAEVKTTEYIERMPGGYFEEIQNLPDAVLGYLLPSRYCESDRFNEMALNITKGCLPGFDQVEAIEKWLQMNIEYIPGSSDYPISAIEVNQRQYGVCRDLAHLGIALCRSISIPTRMVVGYLYNLKPMDLHAWFEAYVGGKWYTFDPVRVGNNGSYVAVGYGRDAADVAIYNQFGPSVFPIEQLIQVERIEHES